MLAHFVLDGDWNPCILADKAGCRSRAEGGRQKPERGVRSRQALPIGMEDSHWPHRKPELTEKNLAAPPLRGSVENAQASFFAKFI